MDAARETCPSLQMTYTRLHASSGDGGNFREKCEAKGGWDHQGNRNQMTCNIRSWCKSSAGKLNWTPRQIERDWRVLICKLTEYLPCLFMEPLAVRHAE